MDLFDKCDGFTRARQVQALGMYPYFIPITDSEGTEVEINGRRLIMAGSNNYLGLTHRPEVIAAARDAVERFGTSCTGSRFLNGTLELHEELERRLARFLDREAALCFSTGFQTNLGVISALCGRDDVIFCDRENHASIFDGCRLSFAELRKYRHEDMGDLERQLEASLEDNVRGRLIIVDGVFSMMGEIANLPRIVELARRYGARVLVDEAHSAGVLGAHGRGAAEHCKVESQVDLVLGTFSKSFASLGGFVAGPESVIHYIKHHARSLIFSASIPPSAAAAALAALDVIEREPGLRADVMQRATMVRDGLEDLGFRVGRTETPIVPVIIGNQDQLFLFWKQLFEAGVFTNPVTGPAVPKGMDLVRSSYMAAHTPAQCQRVIDSFEKVGRRMGLLRAHDQELPSKATVNDG
ncbi:MAG: aminotransferase class I/II-fold pyridoxal phosphate-dependent enzyme [Planctomycetota bacterium]